MIIPQNHFNNDYKNFEKEKLNPFYNIKKWKQNKLTITSFKLLKFLQRLLNNISHFFSILYFYFHISYRKIWMKKISSNIKNKIVKNNITLYSPTPEKDKELILLTIAITFHNIANMDWNTRLPFRQMSEQRLLVDGKQAETCLFVSQCPWKTFPRSTFVSL